jgi:hypothetical protein
MAVHPATRHVPYHVQSRLKDIGYAKEVLGGIVLTDDGLQRIAIDRERVRTFVEADASRDSRNAAGAFLFGRRRCPLRSETCPEGCKVYAGSLLIPAAVGAYCENGPVGAAINPRRVRLIARRG